MNKFSLELLKQHYEGTRPLTLPEREYFLKLGYIRNDLNKYSNPSEETLFNSVGFPLTELGLKAIGIR